MENITEGMRGVASKIPRGWRNIQSVHLKTVDSIALPLYNALPPQATLLPAVAGPREKVPGDLEPADAEEKGVLVSTGSESEVLVPAVKLPSKISRKKIKGSTVVSYKRRRTAKH